MANKPRADRANHAPPRPTLASVWKPAFLTAFAVSMNWTASAAAAKVTRQTAQAAYDADPEFRDAVDQAKESALDNLELVAINRATSGQSDRMIEFMLKSHRRKTYDPPKTMLLGGMDGGPVKLDIVSTIADRLADLAKRTQPPPPGDSGATGGD